MDLDGKWNPPEVWPEADPPLPGWLRGEDGRWHAPAVVPEESVDDHTAGGDDAQPRPRLTIVARDTVRTTTPLPPVGPPLRLAAISALLAGLVALAVAVAGIVVVTFL